MSSAVFNIHDNFDFVTEEDKANEDTFAATLMLGLRDMIGPAGGGVAIVDISRLSVDSDSEKLVTRSKMIDALQRASGMMFPTGEEREDEAITYRNAGYLSGLVADEDGEVKALLITIESDEPAPHFQLDSFGTIEELNEAKEAGEVGEVEVFE